MIVTGREEASVGGFQDAESGGEVAGGGTTWPSWSSCCSLRGGGEIGEFENALVIFFIYASSCLPILKSGRLTVLVENARISLRPLNVLDAGMGAQLADWVCDGRREFWDDWNVAEKTSGGSGALKIAG
jgi:hypothetical protein